MLGVPIFLLSPEVRNAILEDERRKHEALVQSLVSQPVQKWHRDMKWAPLLHIEAKSYEPFVPRLFDVPTVGPFSNDSAERFGDWGYQHIVLPKHHPLFTCLGARMGHVVFDDDVVIPRLWKFNSSEVWMSMTPMEMLSQRPGFSKARGRVMVGGLGMGWALREILTRKSVTSVTVVERCEDILNWFGYRLVEQLEAESGKQIVVLNGDAFEEASARFAEHDSFIFDIWQGYGTARRDKRWRKLSDRAACCKKQAWAWGASGAPNRE
jgi:hypothetical protein